MEVVVEDGVGVVVDDNIDIHYSHFCSWDHTIDDDISNTGAIDVVNDDFDKNDGTTALYNDSYDMKDGIVPVFCAIPAVGPMFMIKIVTHREGNVN